MSNDKIISEHYLHGNLLEAIRTSLAKLGKTVDTVTIDDLAPVDEFHIGGRQATESFLKQLKFPEHGHVLDVGCGLGGASRFVANNFNTHVSGIDLAREYIDTGNTLCAWVSLDKQITLHEGSALSMPFEDELFDGGYMMHVGMNIQNKAKLFEEIYRVLREGASFGVYDVMRDKEGELAYPVPWATDGTASHLHTPQQYKQAMSDAGFEVMGVNDRRDFALEFFEQLRAKTQVDGGPPPLGLHTLMQDTTAEKIQNMINNISKGYVSPVEVIAGKI